MSTDTPSLPDFLDDRLQEEPPEGRSDLGAVWALLGAAGAAGADAADPDAAWDAVVQAHPELDAPPTNGTSGSGRSAEAATEAAPEAAAETSTEAATEADTEPSSSSRRQQRPARPSQKEPSQKDPSQEDSSQKDLSRQGLSRQDSFQRGHAWRAAAGLAVAAVVLVGGLWLWRQPVTVTTPPGQQRTATLPDGSTVDLNSGTTLSYRRDFQAWPFIDAGRRAMRLEGEAFFEVEGAPRPFVIKTASAEVAVTGTRFNVRARPEVGPGGQAPDTPETEVTLVEGRVEVSSRDRPGQPAVLSEPGQASRVAAAAPSAPEPAAVEHVLAWRSNGFAAQARPLATVLRDLERRFDATLRLHDSVDRARAPVSLYYPEAPDLETILHDLCTARDLNYRPTSRGFELFAAPDDR